MTDRNKKEIVFYSPGIYPCKTGGMEVFNYHLIERLLSEDSNYKVSVLTSCDFLHIKRKNYHPAKNRIFITKKYGLGALSTALYYIFSKKISWKNCDVLIVPYTSNFSYSAVAFLLLKSMFNIRYIIHIHGGGMRPWKPVWLQKLFFKNAKKVAGVSEVIIDEYQKRAGRKIAYLPPLVPFNKNNENIRDLKSKLELNQYDKIILFVGSLKPLKAPETLLNAFIELGNEFIKKHKLGLLFVGDGPLKKRLERRVDKSEFENNIKIIGKIPQEYICNYYAISDIFVLPSWYEGTPIVLLEAMFNGLLCVGSNVNGIKNIITHSDNGILFEEGNYNELSNILEKYINNNELRTKIANSGYFYYSSHFDYSQYINKFKNFILND